MEQGCGGCGKVIGIVQYVDKHFYGDGYVLCVKLDDGSGLGVRYDELCNQNLWKNFEYLDEIKTESAWCFAECKLEPIDDCDSCDNNDRGGLRYL
jgi:hypothetical protein